jgi:cation:H+ antiporter
VLVAIFVWYTVRLSKAPPEDPHLVGPSAWLGGFRDLPRRAVVGVMFVFSALVILLAAEPFAEGLVDTGTQLGVSQFLLVQWLAPLASEAPELLVAGLYAWRLYVTNGLATLVSSKVNQWTLLIGTLPLVFAGASHSFSGLPVDPAQSKELLLTAAQSLFAVAILLNLDLSVREALLLLALFAAQFVLGAVAPGTTELTIVSVAYLVLALLMLIRQRRSILPVLRDGLRTPYHELDDDAEGGAALRRPDRGPAPTPPIVGRQPLDRMRRP